MYKKCCCVEKACFCEKECLCRKKWFLLFVQKRPVRAKKYRLQKEGLFCWYRKGLFVQKGQYVQKGLYVSKRTVFAEKNC